MPAPEAAEAPLPSIRRYGSRCLRLQAADAEPGSPRTRELLDRMWEVLAADGGVGLAAPQIGVLERLVVVRDPDQPPGRQRLDLVNPVITGLFGPPVPFEEGCLSFPGLYTTIRRPRGVRLEYHDAAGRPGRLSNDSLVARIVQHEVDHLNGVLFIDHLSAWGKFRAGPRLLLILLLKLLGK